MSLQPGLAGPDILERVLNDPEGNDTTDDAGPYVVILYNDDYHTQEEVILQVRKATAYPLARCVEIMWEAHTKGRAIAYTGSQADCERVARVLRQIRLQVETDQF